MNKTLKNIIVLIVSIISLLLIICFAFCFITFKQGDFSYKVVFGKIHIVECESEKKSIIIPSKINGLKVESFSGITGYSEATSIIISEGVKEIKDAISNCDSLKYIDLPDSLEKITGNSFFNCIALESISLPKNLKKIDVLDSPVCDEQHRYIFDGCEKLKIINVDSENKKYRSYQGLLFNFEKKCLIKCPEAKSGDIVLPNWFEKADEKYDFGNFDYGNDLSFSSFANCKNIISVSFPKTFNSKTYLQSAKDNQYFDLFPNCDKLKFINIDKNNEIYCSVEGVWYSKDMKYLIKQPNANKVKVDKKYYRESAY